MIAILCQTARAIGFTTSIAPDQIDYNIPITQGMLRVYKNLLSHQPTSEEAAAYVMSIKPQMEFKDEEQLLIDGFGYTGTRTTRLKLKVDARRWFLKFALNEFVPEPPEGVKHIKTISGGKVWTIQQPISSYR
ncbi:MAG: hypothetical protein ACE5FT_03910 [Candidatus Nanoarchaeia archaeon]